MLVFLLDTNIGSDNPMNYLTASPAEMFSPATTPQAPGSSTIQPQSLFSPSARGNGSFDARASANSPQTANAMSPGNMSNGGQSNSFMGYQQRSSSASLSQHGTPMQISQSQMMQEIHSSSNSPSSQSQEPMMRIPSSSAQSPNQRFFNGLNNGAVGDSLNGNNSMGRTNENDSLDVKSQYQKMLQQRQMSNQRPSNHSSPNGADNKSPIIGNAPQTPTNQQPTPNLNLGRLNLATMTPQELAVLKKNIQYLTPQQQAAIRRQLLPGQNSQRPPTAQTATSMPPQQSDQPTQQQLLQRQAAQQQRIKQQHQQIQQKEQERLAQMRMQQQNQQSTNSPAAPNRSSPSQAQMSSADKFFKSLTEFMQSRGTPIQGMPVICGRQIHLLQLYGIVLRFGGSAKVQQGNGWPLVANKLGFNSATDSSAPAELERAFNKLLLPFEEFLKSRQAQVRNASQAMQQQTSSDGTRSSPQSRLQGPQTPSQEHFNEQHNKAQEQVRVTPPSFNQKVPPQVSSRGQTPVSRSSSVSSQSVPLHHTPQMKAQSPINSMGDSSTEMPPPRAVVPSPKVAKRDPPVPKPLVRLAKEDGKYKPKRHKVEHNGGYNVQELAQLSADISTLAPEFPLFQELGTIEINALIMALKSMIPGETRQALDKLALLSSNPSVPIVLQECPDLINALGMIGLDLLGNLKSQKKSNTVDVFSQFETSEDLTQDSEKDLISSVFNAYKNWDETNEELVINIDSLTGEPVKAFKDSIEASVALDSVIAADDKDFDNDIGDEKATSGIVASKDGESSTFFGFTPYGQLVESSKEEIEGLHTERQSHVSTFWQDAVVDRFLCVTMILRNLSFTDTNQPSIVRDAAALKFIFASIRALGDNRNLLESERRSLCLQKDLITLLANLGLYIQIPSSADAFSILLLILSFAPEASPYHGADESGEIKFAEYSPVAHRYLACAVDAFAKLIPRDPPNRGLFEEILTGTCTNEEYLSMLERHLQKRIMKPYEFLTRGFALAISTVPRSDYRVIPKALEIRRPLLQQSLLIAENLAMMVPSHGAHSDIMAGMSTEFTCPELYTEFYNDFLSRQSSYNVALEWLEAVEGFGPTLLRASCTLGAIVNPQAARQGDGNPFSKLTQRCIGILHLLGQKAMTFEMDAKSTTSSEETEVSTEPFSDLLNQVASDTPMKDLIENGASQVSLTKIPIGVLPTMEALLGVLLAGNMSEKVVSHLWALSEEGSNFMTSMRRKV